MVTGRVLSQVEVEQQIAEHMDLLEEATHTFDQARKDSARAEVTHKVVYAQQMLTISATRKDLNTVSLREAQATVNTQDGLWARKITEAETDVAKSNMESIRDRLSALQTLLRSIARQT